MRRTATKTRRPKWAKSLTAREWKELQKCQNTKTPSLAQLKRDVEFQTANEMTCWNCRTCLRKATEVGR